MKVAAAAGFRPFRANRKPPLETPRRHARICPYYLKNAI